MSEPLIQASNLSVVLTGRTIIERLPLAVNAGEVVAVIGPNGAGKTTLLRALAGLIPATRGTLRIAGLDPRETPAAEMAHQRVYATQHPDSVWPFTLAELSTLSPDPAECLAWYTRFYLTDKITARLPELSGGERKAAHLALAFSTLGDAYGKVLLLDEPTTSLDLCRAELVRQSAEAAALAGAAVLVATHDLAWARACPRVLVLGAGQLCADGSPDAVLTSKVIRETWSGADA